MRLLIDLKTVVPVASASPPVLDGVEVVGVDLPESLVRWQFGGESEGTHLVNHLVKRVVDEELPSVHKESRREGSVRVRLPHGVDLGVDVSCATGVIPRCDTCARERSASGDAGEEEDTLVNWETPFLFVGQAPRRKVSWGIVRGYLLSNPLRGPSCWGPSHLSFSSWSG